MGHYYRTTESPAQVQQQLPSAWLERHQLPTGITSIKVLASSHHGSMPDRRFVSMVGARSGRNNNAFTIGSPAHRRVICFINCNYHSVTLLQVIVGFIIAYQPLSPGYTHWRIMNTTITVTGTNFHSGFPPQFVNAQYPVSRRHRHQYWYENKSSVFHHHCFRQHFIRSEHNQYHHHCRSTLPSGLMVIVIGIQSVSMFHFTLIMNSLACTHGHHHHIVSHQVSSCLSIAVSFINSHHCWYHALHLPVIECS